MIANIDTKLFKILAIVYCISFSYTIYHYTTNELYFYRFSNIFVGYIEMYLNNHVSFDNISIAPLFNSNIQADISFSNRIQGIIRTESYFLNTISLVLILHYITNLSPQLLQIFPIGIVFIPVTYLAIIKSYILNEKNRFNTISALLLSVYILIYLGLTKIYGSFYVGPPSFLLIFLIFFSLKKYYESEHEKKSYYLILILLAIFSLTHYWHTALIIAILFVLSSFVVSISFLLLEKLNLPIDFDSSLKDIFTKSKAISFISIIIAITFIHLWQSEYLSIYVQDANLIQFITAAINKLLGQTAFPVPYAFNYKEMYWGKIYFKSLLIIYAISALIITLSIIIHILQIKRKNIKIGLPLILTLSLLLAQVIHVLLYYKTNSLDFVYLPLFFSLFGIYLLINSKLDQIKGSNYLKKYMMISLTLLIILSFVCNISLLMTDEVGRTSATKYDNTKSSFEWTYNKINNENKVIVDFNILGKYIQREANEQKMYIDYMDLNTQTYSVLVGDSKLISKYISQNYFVLDHLTMSEGLPVHTTQSRALLIPLLREINDCPSQNKIYDDNYISIFKFN